MPDNAVLLAESKPIRITLDTSSLYDPTAEEICHNVGDRVDWAEGTRIECTPNDILTEKKIKSIEGTLLAVKNFLEQTLSVNQMEEKLTIVQFREDLGLKIPYKTLDTDILISITVRPYPPEQMTLASAIYFAVAPNGRPTQSVVYINPSKIPDEPQNQTTSPQTFFDTLIHELCHGFGVADKAYKSWINRETGKAWGKDIPIMEYEDPNSSKIFKILQTPAAHRFAVDRFGVEEFAPGVPAGIELEDGGGAATALSHPEARVYVDDSMVGLSTTQTRITNLSLSLLEDTGWYEVNYSLAVPSAWGVGESFGSAKLTNFPLGSPALTYPDHYMCHEDEDETCTFDLRGAAGCKGTPQNCTYPSTDEEVEFCKMQNFSDTLHNNIMGDSAIHDYVWFKTPYSDVRCNDVSNNNNHAKERGELFGGKSLCTMSTLARGYFSYFSHAHGACYRMLCDDNDLYVYVDDRRKKCKHTGQKLHFFGFTGHITCPNIEHACGIRRFYGTLGPAPHWVPKTIGLTTYQFWIFIFVVIAFVILALIGFIVICQIFHRRKKATVEEKVIILT